MAPVPAPRPSASPALRAPATLLLAGLLSGCGSDASPPPPPPQPMSATMSAPSPEREKEEEEVVAEVLALSPIDEQETAGDPRFHSDAPFEGTGTSVVIGGGAAGGGAGTNAGIGVGGGAGGAVGGRAKAHRLLRIEAGITMYGGGSAALPLPPAGGSRDVREPSAPGNTESYDSIAENPFHRVTEDPLSTFSVDVDTASYALVRRFLRDGELPPRGAVRIEELVNYFRYAYEPPAGEDPFAVHLAAAAAPWSPGHRLVRIALKGREFDEASRPPANLVFLVDVSGSMRPSNKLPLVKAALRLLARRLDARDRVAVVVYAGSSGLVLPATRGDRDGEILAALDRLESGGSTNGGAGIELAYAVAAEGFVKGGINRVVLATDGDFNVGVTSQSALVDLIEAKAKTGVFLTALGFGMGNVKDSTLERLADRGNGNYAYIDSLREAEKVLVEQMGGTLQTIAKDVKVQVEFNPARAAAYRLIGYENRMLRARDFNDDAKDAGEIGAGHCVTALYEVIPAGTEAPGPAVDALRYQEPGRPSTPGEVSGELLTVKLRWKEPEGEVSRMEAFPLPDGGAAFDDAPEDFRFAAAVASFGMLLRGSEHGGAASLEAVKEIAASALGSDPGGYRAEFLTLVEKAEALRK